MENLSGHATCGCPLKLPRDQLFVLLPTQKSHKVQQWTVILEKSSFRVRPGSQAWYDRHPPQDSRLTLSQVLWPPSTLVCPRFHRLLTSPTQSLDYTGCSNNNTSSVFIIIPCAENFPINYLRPPTITVPSAEEKTQPTRGRLRLSRE